MAFKFLSEYDGEDISDFNVLVYLKRAREHFDGMNNAKDNTGIKFHEKRFSVYHDYFLQKLKPNDVPMEKSKDQAMSESDKVIVVMYWTLKCFNNHLCCFRIQFHLKI